MNKPLKPTGITDKKQPTEGDAKVILASWKNLRAGGSFAFTQLSVTSQNMTMVRITIDEINMKSTMYMGTENWKLLIRLK